MAPYHIVQHTTVAFPHGLSNISTSRFAHSVGSHLESEAQLNSEGLIWNTLEPDEESLWLSLGYTKHSWNNSTYWCPPTYPQGDLILPQPSSNDVDWSNAPNPDLNNMAHWNKCHLLSLPKELRLEIWRHVLTDPSVPELAVEIAREPLSPIKSSLRFPSPCIMTTLQPPRNCPIALEVLRANRSIYEEALPLLYHSVKFAPLDLGSIFPMFLDPIGPLARSHIRRIKLRVPASLYDINIFGDPSSSTIQWAVTCAQVAKVESVQEVEVEGFCAGVGSKRLQRSLLYPLCKIKARKILVGPEHNAAAQQSLAVFEEEWKAQAPLRRERTLSEATERAARDELLKQQAERQEEERRRRCPVISTSESVVDRGIAQIPGLRQFEEELEEHARSVDGPELPEDETLDFAIGEWDVVSLPSGGSTPRLLSCFSRRASTSSEDIWTDTASTMVDWEGATKSRDPDEQSAY